MLEAHFHEVQGHDILRIKRSLKNYGILKLSSLIKSHKKQFIKHTFRSLSAILQFNLLKKLGRDLYLDRLFKLLILSYIFQIQ